MEPKGSSPREVHLEPEQVGEVVGEAERRVEARAERDARRLEVCDDGAGDRVQERRGAGAVRRGEHDGAGVDAALPDRIGRRDAFQLSGSAFQQQRVVQRRRAEEAPVDERKPGQKLRRVRERVQRMPLLRRRRRCETRYRLPPPEQFARARPAASQQPARPVARGSREAVGLYAGAAKRSGGLGAGVGDLAAEGAACTEPVVERVLAPCRQGGEAGGEGGEGLVQHGRQLGGAGGGAVEPVHGEFAGAGDALGRRGVLARQFVEGGFEVVADGGVELFGLREQLEQRLSEAVGAAGERGEEVVRKGVLGGAAGFELERVGLGIGRRVRRVRGDVEALGKGGGFALEALPGVAGGGFGSGARRGFLEPLERGGRQREGAGEDAAQRLGERGRVGAGFAGFGGLVAQRPEPVGGLAGRGPNGLRPVGRHGLSESGGFAQQRLFQQDLDGAQAEPPPGALVPLPPPRPGRLHPAPGGLVVRRQRTVGEEAERAAFRHVVEQSGLGLLQRIGEGGEPERLRSGLGRCNRPVQRVGGGAERIRTGCFERRVGPLAAGAHEAAHHVGGFLLEARVIGDERRREADLLVEGEQSAKRHVLRDGLGRALRAADEAPAGVGGAAAALGPGAAAALGRAPEARGGTVGRVRLEQRVGLGYGERIRHAVGRGERAERVRAGGEHGARWAELVEAVLERNQDVLAHGRAVGAGRAGGVQQVASPGVGGAGRGGQCGERLRHLGLDACGEGVGGGLGAGVGGGEVAAERGVGFQPGGRKAGAVREGRVRIGRGRLGRGRLRREGTGLVGRHRLRHRVRAHRSGGARGGEGCPGG